MKYICFVLSLLLYTNATFSQLIYPIVGTYNKKSAQGMAIHGDYAFLFNDGGGCRKLNLLSGKILFVENPYKSTTFHELENAIKVGEQLILEFNLKVEVCIVVDTDTVYSLKNACSNKS